MAIASGDKLGQGHSEKISMTAPVMMSPMSMNTDDPKDSSEKISMTAPVSMRQSQGRWQVAFVMPEVYSLQTLPKPNNPAIILKQIPELRYAVIKFSGRAGEDAVAEKTTALQQWMANKQLIAIGDPEIARYNPPWTLPFMRRNEIMIAYQ